MKAISIRQPWAWLILFGGKTIENRTWRTHLRGRVLIHASQHADLGEWHRAVEFARDVCGVNQQVLDLMGEMKQMPRGGLVGSVEIVDCVSTSDSPWFVGPNGFVLRNPRPMTFVRCLGTQRFFNIPDSIVPADLREEVSA